MQAIKSTRISILFHQLKRKWAMTKLAQMPDSWEPNITNQMRIQSWRSAK